MYKNSIIGNLRHNIANIPGWRTKRRIVVIESDDWGSVRTFNSESFESMKSTGLNVDNNHYDKFDSLESNDDLEMLFSLLSEFKDTNGNHPIITAMCLMGNPDFEKIEQSGFESYFFQPLEETLNYYPNHSNVLSLWKKGRSERLFFPALHGREHLNVRRYLKLLQREDSGMRIALKNKSIGVDSYLGKLFPNYLGALQPESLVELTELHNYLIEASSFFFKYNSYNPTCFIAPNREEPKELEDTLNKIGVKYLTRSKNRLYPIGDGTFKKEINWLGKQNNHNQICIVRNCYFEPACFGDASQEYVTDWVNHCLKEIEIAFRWKKPAVISSHRVNYIGSINPANRENGLREFRKLLKTMLVNWPDIEFMTTEELGDLIRLEKHIQ